MDKVHKPSHSDRRLCVLSLEVFTRSTIQMLAQDPGRAMHYYMIQHSLNLGLGALSRSNKTAI
jgi:hypothetical protein